MRIFFAVCFALLTSSAFAHTPTSDRHRPTIRCCKVCPSETYGAPLAAEQPGAEMFFQLADARRHIGLKAIELVGCTDDPALVNDGSEDLQRLQNDCSHNENDTVELFICAKLIAGPYSAA